jgi:hypothetical protein
MGERRVVRRVADVVCRIRRRGSAATSCCALSTSSPVCDRYERPHRRPHHHTVRPLRISGRRVPARHPRRYCRPPYDRSWGDCARVRPVRSVFGGCGPFRSAAKLARVVFDERPIRRGSRPRERLVSAVTRAATPRFEPLLGACSGLPVSHDFEARFVSPTADRLGLRAGELAHVRTAWVNWSRRAIPVPGGGGVLRRLHVSTSVSPAPRQLLYPVTSLASRCTRLPVPACESQRFGEPHGEKDL